MGQNKNQIISILIGNLSNAIVHKILEKSIDKNELIGKYRNEAINSYNIAKRYREKINPVDNILSINDSEYIKEKLRTKVRNELNLRISKGYTNINLTLIDSEIENFFIELRI